MSARATTTTHNEAPSTVARRTRLGSEPPFSNSRPRRRAISCSKGKNSPTGTDDSNAYNAARPPNSVAPRMRPAKISVMYEATAWIASPTTTGVALPNGAPPRNRRHKPSTAERGGVMAAGQ